MELQRRVACAGCLGAGPGHSHLRVVSSSGGFGSSVFPLRSDGDHLLTWSTQKLHPPTFLDLHAGPRVLASLVSVHPNPQKSVPRAAAAIPASVGLPVK